MSEAIKSKLLDWSEEYREEMISTANMLWENPELGLLEFESSRYLSELMEEREFHVERGVADLPTAYIASYGEGRPIIGLLAEFDAVPDSDNDRVPYVQSLKESNVGHGCGHNLIGTCATWTGIGLKELMADRDIPGTVRVYGCPAEELLVGKVFMARAGLFNDLDAILFWHPQYNNYCNYGGNLALISVKFKFTGQACHIPSSRTVGRNALDAVELLNVAANLRQKHLDKETTLEYVITQGGSQPNVSPGFSEVWYFIRSDVMAKAEEAYADVVKCAKGAALATGTTLETEIITGCREYLANKTLAEALYKNFQRLGPPHFTVEELEFARKIQDHFNLHLPKSLDDEITLWNGTVPSSQDDGDASWIVPHGRFNTAGWVIGVPGHTWGVTATCGTSIGQKALLTAIQVMGLTAVDLYTSPDLLAKAREEFKVEASRVPYKCFVPDHIGPPSPSQIYPNS